MAYKKYRRYTRSKQNKRFNKYAYNKTDAKSQSKQIVSLNKKIDRVYKNLKPEIIRINKQGTSTISQAKPVVINFETLLGDSITNIYKGNYAKNIYFNFRMYYNPNSRDLTQGHTFRVMVIQNRIPLDAAPDAESLFIDSSASWGVFAPFKDNIRNSYKILLSRVMNLSSDRDCLYRAFNFKKLLSYKKTTGDIAAYPRGCIFVLVLAPSGQSEISFIWTSKLGIVDN